MLAVKFLQSYEPYEPGHVVDLPDALAQSLIDAGTCRAYSSPILPAQVTTTNDEPTVTGGTNA